jgi:hypothetical protein
MSETNNLALTYIDGPLVEWWATLNRNLGRLDSLVQIAVLDRDLATPPAAPSEGERWIVAASPTGDWIGHASHVAAWQDGRWLFGVPRVGWLAYAIDEGTLLTWNGTAWGDFFSTVTSIQNLSRLGVGTTADATNPMSAKLNNALWAARSVAEGGSGDLRYKLSKESASHTLSLLLQTNFSGRAEIGLAGDDDLRIKVSPDGSSWLDALVVSKATGRIAFPANGGPRETLTANRTYYVRTDGNDANDGLANSAGGAFLTLQKAVNTALNGIDLGGYDVVIQVGNGTYTAGVSVGAPWVGAGKVTLQGDTASPGNVVISTAGHCIALSDHAVLHLQGFKLTSSTANTVNLVSGAILYLDGKMEFGAASAAFHLNVSRNSLVAVNADYSITGGSAAHWQLGSGSSLICIGRTITLSGTPNFSGAFASGAALGVVSCPSCTFSGAATGMRYSVQLNSVIYTNGGGANFLPGSVAGTTATGGQYA